MKHTRELTGMAVTELRAATQPELFKMLAKFAGGRHIDTVDVYMLREEETDDPTRLEVATVVWA